MDLVLQPALVDGFRQIRRVGRRAAKYRRMEVLHYRELSRGISGRRGNDRRAHHLGAVVYAETAGEQSVAVGHDLGFDMDKLNVNGGAIALGHPVGASGCRILVTLLHEMAKRDAKKGLATLCIGGGMGCSAIVTRD